MVTLGLDISTTCVGYAFTENKKILDNLSLEINEGEVHAIMGPNGSGKSTLSNVLAGSEEYNINSGEIKFNDSVSLDSNNLGTNYVNGDQVKIPWNDHNGAARHIKVTLLVSDRNITTRAAQNFNPFDVIIC